MIPETFISALLERADIVDVVGRYVHLKKAGRNYTACCPFHKEKTPSFAVNAQRQMFKCFGCGKAGTVIKFLMEIEKLSFPDAVNKLADMYGMIVPVENKAQAKAQKVARTLTDYMKEASEFYSVQLQISSKALNYLKQREISQVTAKKFALGYSPDGWHSLQNLFKEKYEDKALETVGLVNVKNSNRYDAFRDRLMFPIRNPRGQVIGFGARTFKGDEQPKYLNSPETPIYHKGKELYGLYEGKDAIYAKKRAIVCEGYMDVIQLSQAGFEEAVAALGTSITPEHIQKLFKITDSVYFSFDGDAAGRKAAKRALDSAISVVTDMQQAHFVLLPAEHDPDSLIKAKGPAAFEEEIEGALTLTQFLKSLLVEGLDLTYLEDRAKLIGLAKPYLIQMGKAPLLRLGLMKELASLAKVQIEDIEKTCGLVKAESTFELSKYQQQRNPSSGSAWSSFNSRNWNFPAQGLRSTRKIEPKIGVRDVRDRLLNLFLCYPILLTEFSSSIEEEFLGSNSPASKRIIEVWQACHINDEDDTNTQESTGSLLVKLYQSANYSMYEAMVTEELDTVNTSLEVARLEVSSTFLEFELERSKARALELAKEGKTPAEVLYQALNHNKMLQKQIDETKADIRELRLKQDNEARLALEEERRALLEAKKPTNNTSKSVTNPMLKKYGDELRALFAGAPSGERDKEEKENTRSFSDVRKEMREFSNTNPGFAPQAQLTENPALPVPLAVNEDPFSSINLGEAVDVAGIDADERSSLDAYTEEDIAREIGNQSNNEEDGFEPIDFSDIDDSAEPDWSSMPQFDEPTEDF